jgi:hypothetical protein
MKVQRLGFISILMITFFLGWSLNTWSAEQTGEEESYKKEVQEILEILDKKIDELKGKAAELKETAKTEFDTEMGKLRKKQEATKEKWEELKRATAANWEKVKASMDAAVQEVESAYDEAAARLKERKD